MKEFGILRARKVEKRTALRVFGKMQNPTGQFAILASPVAR